MRIRTLAVGVAGLMMMVAPRLLPGQERGAAALGDAVRAVGPSARVLVIGAHPDDEDTQLITWLAKGHHVETAYLSLTRGDGGQNLIGNELGNGLGAIRTEELLAARRLDGGRQYFTRAYDFGFSKSAEETLKHWPREQLLRDVVTVVRAFRPTVIVAMFSGTPADGHGHHQLSGILAREAFDAAADTVRFPRSATMGMGAWAPRKFFRGAYTTPRAQATVVFNTGEYNPVLGRSYAELASESRSQHLSQGFGILQNKGVRFDFVKLEALRATPGGASQPATGAERDASIFTGIDTSWARFSTVRLSPDSRAALDSLGGAVAAAQRALDVFNPQPVVAPLANVARLAVKVRLGFECEEKAVAECAGDLGDLAVSLETLHRRATDALLQAAGVAVEATADRERVAVGDSVEVTVSLFNRGRAPVSYQWGVLEQGRTLSRIGGASAEIAPDSALRVKGQLLMDRTSNPWWLTRPRKGDVFDLVPRDTIAGVPAVKELVIGEDRVATSTADIRLAIAGTEVNAIVSPVIYRFADPARGEVHRPLAGAPGLAVNLEREVEYAPAGAPIDRTVQVKVVSALRNATDATVSLDVPAGLHVDSASRVVTIPALGSATVFFRLQGTLAAGRHPLRAFAQAGGVKYGAGYSTIEYAHIRPQRLYRDAVTTLVSTDVKVPASLRIAYIQGVGDNVAPTLQQLGIPVTIIDPAELPRLDLSKFSTLVVGPRAYESNEMLVANNARVLDFARRGGTVVVQYGQFEMARPGIMPFPITQTRPADRVTEEDAQVRVLDPASTLMAGPNRIDDRDFRDWVQERALYMPHTFDDQYHTPLSMNDTGEPPQNGAIMVAALGKGVYVYTTLSFFRQLPAGVAGPARLFINVLAADPRAAQGARPPAAVVPKP